MVDLYCMHILFSYTSIGNDRSNDLNWFLLCYSQDLAVLTYW